MPRPKNDVNQMAGSKRIGRPEKWRFREKSIQCELLLGEVTASLPPEQGRVDNCRVLHGSRDLAALSRLDFRIVKG